MINLTTQRLNIATASALSIATALTLTVVILQPSQTAVAQEFFDSSPALGSQLGEFAEMQAGQSVLDFPDRPEDLNGSEDMNVLTRGPLHEAFASAHQADPQPASLIFKAPPELIDEVPPEYKPDGNNVQWISGYWAWDDAQTDFIWISGIWRDVPPSRRWIPGYWDAEGGGHRWVSGIWTEETQLELGYLPQPPASIDQGPSTIAPGEDYFYVPGNWAYRGSNYRWLTGHWQPIVENRIWIPASYVWTPNGCVYQAGYWDYEIQNRGTCFAPVQFTQPVYLTNNYSYRPSFAINLNVDFLTHLFVRPRCGHYFYGDWYASNFNNVHYRPWVSYSSHYRSYDPLLAYYGHRRSSFDSRYNVVQYLTRQHNFYVNNRDYRPRPTYRSQYKHANNLKHRHASGPSNLNGQRRPHDDYVLKSTYVRTYKDLRTHGDRRSGQTVDARNRGNQQGRPQKHHKVAEKELRDTRRKVDQLANVQRERKRKEHSERQFSGTHTVARIPSGGLQTQNRSVTRQRELEQLRRSSERASQATADANRRQLQAAQSLSRELTRSDRNSDRRNVDSNRQRSNQPDRRTQPTRNVQQDLARLAAQQQARQQADREAARRSDQQNQARVAQQDRARRTQQDQARRVQQDQARRSQQDQARRSQQEQVRRSQQQDQARRTQQDQARRVQQQTISRAQDQVRRTQQEQARRVQNDQARRAQQEQTRRSRQQEQTRRGQQEQTRRAQQESTRRAQQDQARRTQQAAANRARQDQARRAQQSAQQERSRQQAAQRAKQQQSQRAAAQRAQQKSQRDAAKRVQASRQKSAQRTRTASTQKSNSSRTRTRSKSKK